MPKGFSCERKHNPSCDWCSIYNWQLNKAHWSEQTKAQNKRERNVSRFEAAVWGRGALCDSGPSGCEGDYWFNNLQRAALLISLVPCPYDKICSKFGQQQLVTVNYTVCGFNQSETKKYFEWIIIAFVWCCEFKAKKILAKSLPPNNC